MSRGATLALKITGDVSGGISALDEADGKASRLGGTMGKLGAGIAAGAAAGAAALVGLGISAYNAASDAQQAAGAVDAVFGANAAQMKAYAAAAVDTVGLSASAYNQLSSVLGAQLSNAGFAGEKLSGTVNNLVGLGADLSAQFGGSTADAVEALSSVLKGETDPIERYGISIKQSDISARLAALGQDKLTGAALKTATAQAALTLVTEQSKSAQGAFAREGDTAAQSTQKLGAMWENFQASLGQRLLPLVTKVADFLRGTVLPIVSQWTEEGGFLYTAWQSISSFLSGQLIPALTSLWNEIAPKVLPILQTMGSVINDFLVPAFKAIWGFIQQYVIPIFKSVLGPALEGVSSVWHKLEDALERNRGKFVAIYDNIKPLLEFLKNTVAPFIGGALKMGFEGLGFVIGKVVDAIAWVLDKASAVGGFIGKVGGFLFGGTAGGGTGGAVRGAPPVFGAAAGAAGLFASSYSIGGGAGPSAAGGLLLPVGDTYNITITGALDPVAVADQLADMLDRRARRLGLMPAGARA